MAISVNDFGKAVVAAGLMSADELKSLWDGLAAEARPKNGTAFGKLLETRGKLTSYQSAELAEGNGTSLVLGDYVILAKIGAGGMGQVFKAEHRRMKRLVAIKLLPPAMTKDEAAVKRFQREVEAAAKLSHPNIVTAHDAGVARGAHYLVMEYVEGKDLSHLVKSRGPLPVAESVNYITQAARGLAYAHSRGVVHRDIKPANLLLDAEGTVKILDMGLARFDDVNAVMAAAEEGLTQSGQVMGTVDYMAPEQAFDTRQADARADIYSLGCSLYRLLIGENVYTGDTVMQKFLAHREKPIPSLREKRPEISEALDAVFQKMMAKLPEDRYQPTSLLVADLEACALPTGSTANLAALQATNTFVPNGLSGKSPATEVEDGMTAALGNQLMRSLPDSRTPPRDETFNSSINDRTQRGRKGQPTRIAGGKKPPWNNPIVLSAAGAGALLIVLLGIWVIVRDKDGKPVAKVEVPEGGSVQMKTGQGDKTETATKSNVKPAQGSASSGLIGSASLGDYALDFDGQTSYVEIPSLSRDEAGDFTLEAYVKLRDWVSSKLIVREEGKASCQMYVLFIPGRERTLHGMDETGKTIMSSNDALPLDQRVHLAYSVGKEDQRLYLNGKEVSRDKRGAGLVSQTGRQGTWIGAHPNEEGKIHYFFPGTIDELRISKTARYAKDFVPAPRSEPDAATAALYHFDEGAGDVLKDSSGHGHHGKITGAKWVRADGMKTSPPKTVGASEFVTLFNGRDLAGWTQVGERGWTVQNGVLVGKTAGPPGWLMSDQEYTDVELELEYKLPAGGNSGVFLRAWPDGGATGANFHEIQLLDDAAPQFANLAKNTKNGSIFKQVERTLTPQAPAGAWNQLQIVNRGERVQVTMNGLRVVDGNLPAGKHSFGHIGLQLFTPGGGEFRNIRARDLSKNSAMPPAESRPAATINTSTVVYLDDLEEATTSLKNLGKHGKDESGQAIDWLGEKPAHGLFTHPDKNRMVFVTYALDEKYDRFQTTIGVVSKPATPLVFRIWGDDKQLWESPPQRLGQSGTDADVSVRGIRALKLEVHCPGSLYYAQAVWINPRLTPRATTDNTQNIPPAAKAPFNAVEAKAHQAAWAKHLGTQVETVNKVGAKMVLIPPGEFLMGSTDAQVDAALKAAVKVKTLKRYQDAIRNDERPQHRVVLTRPFRMGATEVTIGQFKKFVSATKYVTEAERFGGGNSANMPETDPQLKNLTWRAPSYPVTDDAPVSEVTWNDVVMFCNWLSDQEKLAHCYRQDAKEGWVPVQAAIGYRVPTEAEWEYACRAGTTTQYSFGDDAAPLPNYAVFEKIGGNGAKGVGLKLPNAFGLYDMHGNLREWCQDWYDGPWYENSPVNDPQGPPSGNERVLRGGTWFFDASHCRSAFRDHNFLTRRSDASGFRVVRVLEPSVTMASTGQPTSSAGFVSLFNGKDLTGWKAHPEHSGNWRVESGILIGSGEHTTYLFSNRDDYSNFHVRVETRIESGGSAGISCRSPFEGKSVGQNSRPRVLGYLAKINPDSAFDPRKTGSLYVMEPAGFKDGNVIGGSAVRPGEWFTLDIIAQGNHVVIQVNGQTTTDFLDSRNLFSKGHIALQVMSGDKKVEFRKIEIKELGAGAK